MKLIKTLLIICWALVSPAMSKNLREDGRSEEELDEMQFLEDKGILQLFLEIMANPDETTADFICPAR